MTAAAGDVQVRRDEAAASGFAMIVEQFLSQSLSDSDEKRRRAQGLNGRIAMTAADYDQSVTLVFDGGSVEIVDGRAEPLDAAISGPYDTLVNLIQGDDSPLRAHLERRIKVKSSLKKPFFPLHVHNVMKLEDEEKKPGFVGDVAGPAVISAVLIAAVAVLFQAT